MLLRFSRRQARQETIERLYGVIVAQARLPCFYEQYAVPDTMEGRFDLLVLHVHLLFRRLTGSGEPEREIGQAVFDHFLSDMDAVLREIGTGDLAVPKKMRAIGEAYYGRANVYEAALREQGNAKLIEALARNVYAETEKSAVAAARLAAYVREAVASLSAQDASKIAGGTVHFPDPEQVRA